MKQANRTPNEGTVFTTTLNTIFEEFDLPHLIDYASIVSIKKNMINRFLTNVLFFRTSRVLSSMP